MLDPEQLHLLESLVNQVALAIERTRLSEEAQHAHVRAETERMRNAILSSVSHDLRTPLATITGAASSLAEEQRVLDPAARRELSRSIYREADRLDRLLKNLLDMMRLEAGAVQLSKEWHPIDEVVGAALARLEGRLREHTVQHGVSSRSAAGVSRWSAAGTSGHQPSGECREVCAFGRPD